MSGWKLPGYTCVPFEPPMNSYADRDLVQNNDDAKVILANAVQHVGQSVKIWMAAADLEHDVKAKKRVLRKGAPIAWRRIFSPDRIS